MPIVVIIGEINSGRCSFKHWDSVEYNRSMSKDTSINTSEKSSKSQTTTELPLATTDKTRISTAWLMIVSFIIGLILLLIFILQNLRNTSVQFFSLHWEIPLGVAMLPASVANFLSK